MRRTTLPVIAVGVVLLGAGVLSAWQVHRLHRRSSDILSQNVSSIRAAEEFEAVTHELRYRLKRFLGTGNQRHLEEISGLLPRGVRRLNRARKLTETPREEQLVDAIGRGYERFTVGFERAASAGDDELSAIAGRLADEVIPDHILAYTKPYIQLHEEQLADNTERNEARANQLMFGLLLLGTCGGVAGLLSGFAIARRVNRIIVRLSLPLRHTAGKLDKVVGPISVSADPGFDDLESILQTVSQRVSMVIERLQESQREMLRAEQLAALGQMAAGLAHELRNPLTSVKTILQLADAPEELTARDLDVLKQEMTRLEEAVQTFLDFARPPRPEKRPVDIEQLLGETVELVRRRAERNHIRLDFPAGERPISVVADATQVRQVVLNLLLNALDAVPPGGTVHLESDVEGKPPAASHGRWKRRRNGWAAVRVSDNGTGLPEKLAERVFEPFVSTKESGTGLGLSICKRILEAHGGEITAANAPEGGAVFTVRLPLAETPPTAAHTGAEYAETVDCR